MALRRNPEALATNAGATVEESSRMRSPSPSTTPIASAARVAPITRRAHKERRDRVNLPQGKPFRLPPGAAGHRSRSQLS